MEIVGLLLPPIIDLVNRFIKDKSLRFLAAFLICSLFGLGLNWLQTSFSFASPLEGFQSLSASILAVFGASQVSYNLGYEDSKIQDAIRKVN